LSEKSSRGGVEVVIGGMLGVRFGLGVFAGFGYPTFEVPDNVIVEMLIWKIPDEKIDDSRPTMRTRKIFWIILALASGCKLSGATAAAELNGWEKLNLSSAHIADATVYYEKCFEPKLPIFEREYKKFLAEKERGKAINAQKNQIIADINQILGISEPDTEMQDKLWTGLLGVFSIEKTTFYIVKQGTIKDLLRAGGQLPNFTYDKASDTGTYNPEFKTTSNPQTHTGDGSVMVLQTR